MSKFNHLAFLELLKKLADAPSTQLDRKFAGEISTFLKSKNESEFTDVEVWNYYKYLLDMSVHCGAASGMIVAVLDLEPYYHAPKDGYKQRDGSIERAPWRQRPF